MNMNYSVSKHLGICVVTFWLPFCGLVSSSRAAEPKLGRGAALYQTCAQCHGEKGEGNEATQAPRLAGREGWYITKQLEEFRRRQRGKDESHDKGFLPPPERTQMMHPVVDPLTRADTRALIAYIDTLRPEPVPPSRTGDRVRGRELYTDCAACHGKTAGGSRLRGAPRLTDQPDWYIYNQVRDFRMGWRGVGADNPHVKIMRRQLDRDDKSLRDLTAFIVSQNHRAANR